MTTGRKLSKSDIVLTREQELAARARVAAGPDPSRCQHFAPGTDVVILGETFAVIETTPDRRTLCLRAQDGSERTVLRP